MKFSMNTLIFRGQPIEEVLALIKNSGYDGVEIAWVPKEHFFYWGEDVNVPKTKRICDSIGLKVSSICPFFPRQYDLANTSDSIRKNGINYVKSVVDAANELGASIVVVVPSAVMKDPSGSFEAEWSSCIDSLRELGPYAAKKNVTLAIEPIMRFLTYFVTRVDQGLKLVKNAGVPGLGIMADIFHMNVEESSIEDAIKEAGEKLVHIHVSDSNNLVPGTGHLDFESIFRAVNSIGYKGFLSAELGVDKSEAAKAARAAIKYLRSVEQRIR